MTFTYKLFFLLGLFAISETLLASTFTIINTSQEPVTLQYAPVSSEKGKCIPTDFYRAETISIDPNKSKDVHVNTGSQLCTKVVEGQFHPNLTFAQNPHNTKLYYPGTCCSSTLCETEALHGKHCDNLSKRIARLKRRYDDCKKKHLDCSQIKILIRSKLKRSCFPITGTNMLACKVLKNMIEANPQQTSPH